MLLSIFTRLSEAMSASASIALTGAFLWGILSILLSPCHLASIPLIVGFINGQGKIAVKRAFFLSLSFSLGILITIGIIGLITGLLGRMLGDTGPAGKYLVGFVVILAGLYLLDWLPLPVNAASVAGFKFRGIIASFILGLIFGVALGPCTFAFMAPVLGAVFTAAPTNLFYAVVLLLAYGTGHISVIVFAGTFTEAVQSYLDWNEKSKGAVILKKICGILVIIGGIYLMLK
ncbi:MAG: cytochrome C biogenesis protein [Elusimicrobia bacterium RIFOXYA2_FULL_39_19]|nr:MAG: cytochrome C biogenesis protein [Elusimicrobia bacterium RIFOXYA2_FULL_39_19]